MPSLRDRALLPLILLALCVRFLVATASPIINADAYFYLDAAAMYRAGDWHGALWTWKLHPLYPLLVARLESLVPDPWAAGALLGVLGGAAAAVALYGLALDGWGRLPARCTALLYALHPIYSELHGKVLTEGLYQCGALWAVFLLWRGVRLGSWRYGLAGGASLGCAYLTRSEGVLLTILLFGILGIALLLPRFRHGWRALAPALAVLILLALPFLLAIRAEYGRWAPSPRGSVHRAMATERIADPTDSEDERLLRERLGLPLASVANVVRQGIKIYWRVPIALALLTLFFFRRGSSGGWTGAFLGLLSCGGLSAMMLYYYLSVTHLSSRYVSLSAAVLLPWAGWGLACLGARLGSRPVVSGALSLVLCAVLLAPSVDFRNLEQRPSREAADWLLQNGGRGTRIIASRDSIAYHAQARFVYTGDRDPPEMVKNGAADWVVLEDKDLEALPQDVRERLLSLPNLVPAKRFGEEGRGAAIYEVRR